MENVYNYIMGVFSALINIPLSLLNVLFYTVVGAVKTICMLDAYDEEIPEGEAAKNNDKHIGFRQ